MRDEKNRKKRNFIGIIGAAIFALVWFMLFSAFPASSADSRLKSLIEPLFHLPTQATIYANAQANYLEVNPGVPVTITIDFMPDPFEFYGESDWFIFHWAPDGRLDYYDFTFGKWVPGMGFSWQGPAQATVGLVVDTLTDLEEGYHLFGFLLDSTPTGKAEWFGRFAFDCVVVNVTTSPPPIVERYRDR